VNWQQAPADLHLDERRVDIWRKPLTSDRDDLASLLGCLSPDEQQRAQRLKFEQHRRRFIVARASLRQILALYVDRRPSTLRFKYSEQGKPFLASSTIERVPQFSVSHSDDLAVYAISARSLVGIDIERLRPRLNRERLAQRFFSPAEYRFLTALPADQQNVSFHALWTIKEAWLKATGKGLAGLGQALTDPLPQTSASNWIDRIRIQGAAGWETRCFNPTPAYIGALVCGTGPALVECFDAEDTPPF
jgi:4'-phosphopantetheinyl transferase